LEFVFFQAEDGIRDRNVTGVQTCALPISKRVRLAFYMAGMCHNYKEIRTALNRLEEAEGTGKVWNGTPLRNLLTNLACIGDYLSNKECIYADEDGVIHRGKNRGYADQYYIEAQIGRA